MNFLPYLMDFDQQDNRSRNGWDLAHSSDHDEIRQTIQSQLTLNLPDHVLYPVNWTDWDGYALRHQAEHNQMNDALGIDGVDLTLVDFQDAQSRQEWNLNHFREHQAARSLLGI